MPNHAAVLRRGIGFESIEHGILYLAVFLAPFALFRVFDLFFTVSDVLFCLSLFCLAFTGQIHTSPLHNATPLWLTAGALLFAGLMMSSLINGDPARGVIVTAQYLFSYILLLVIVVRSDIFVARRIAAVFVLSILLIDIHGIITFYAVGYAPGQGRGIVTGGRRLATFLRNPNLAANVNALAMPFLLYFWSTSRLKTIFAIPTIFIVLFAVVLTSSNSGLIVMIISVGAFMIFVITPYLLLRLAIAGGLAAFVFLASGGTSLLPKTFQTRVLDAFVSGDITEAGTFVSRNELMKEALSVISNEGILLVGLGADQFREISALAAPVHNLYLLLWVEGGLIALVGWILFSVVGAQIWLAIWRSGGPKQLLALIAATIATFLTIALFSPHMYARYWTLPILMAYGFGIAYLRRPVEALERRTFK